MDCRYENSHEQLPDAKLERLFLYCLTWSLGALLSEKERPSFDAELRSIGGSLPPKYEHMSLRDVGSAPA